MSYSVEFKIFVATIYGEAAGQSEASWKSVAFSMKNRVGFGDWTRCKNIQDVVTKTGYDAYNDQTSLYRKAKNALDNNAPFDLLNRIIAAVEPVYNGTEPDFTRNVVFYYSPKAQKQLHASNPSKYPHLKPPFALDPNTEEVVIQGTGSDDFKFYRYKCSKIFATFKDGKGLPLTGASVDIVFADGKNVAALSDMTTTANGNIPPFFVKTGMGTRFVVNGTKVTDDKGKEIKVVADGVNKKVIVIVNQDGKGYSSKTDIHQGNPPKESPVQPSPKNNNASNNIVNFLISLHEADSGAPISNVDFILEYKGSKKHHKTNSSGLDTNISAQTGEIINVYLQGQTDDQKVAYFEVNETIKHIKVKVPIHRFTLSLKDINNKPIEGYEFSVLYRGKTKTKKLPATGSLQITALAGQEIDFLTNSGSPLFSNYIVDLRKPTLDLVMQSQNVTNQTNSVTSLNSKSDASGKPSTNSNTTPKNTTPKQSVEETRSKNGNPITKISSNEAQFVIEFIDEQTNKYLSSYSYTLESAKYGKRPHISGSDGKKTHTTVVADTVKIIVNVNGDEKILETFSVNKNTPVKSYKVVKPKLQSYLFPLVVKNKPLSYKSGMGIYGSRRSKGKRKHAGCDLYAPAGTEVRAMAAGIVREVYYFYDNTDAIEIVHDKHIVRYGEVAKGKSLVKKGDSVRRGQTIGYVGHLTTQGIPSMMLHLEMYSNPKDDRTLSGTSVYKRRSDLIDPTHFLDESEL